MVFPVFCGWFCRFLWFRLQDNVPNDAARFVRVSVFWCVFLWSVCGARLFFSGYFRYAVLSWSLESCAVDPYPQANSDVPV